MDKDTIGRIPTKMYEALYHKKPMITQNDSFWKKFNKKYDSCLLYTSDAADD